MKINIEEITKEINKNEYTPNKKWIYHTIEYIETINTTWGKMEKYEITIRFKAKRYEDNGIKYQINNYIEQEKYVCYYNGATFIK